MFQDLDWRGAVKRAFLTVLFYLLLVYVLSVAAPGTVGSPFAVALNAALLFALFTLFHAFVDRRKRRREAARRAELKGKKPAGKGDAKAADESDEEARVSALKGRQNPNTSRRKAARRRR